MTGQIGSREVQVGRTEVRWEEWFSASTKEAEHFERVRQAMRLAGLSTDPETVIEVARYILKDSNAPSRLRKLADVWEKKEEVGNPLELVS
jgi:hypothetical protein